MEIYLVTITGIYLKKHQISFNENSKYKPNPTGHKFGKGFLLELSKITLHAYT